MSRVPGGQKTEKLKEPSHVGKCMNFSSEYLYEGSGPQLTSPAAVFETGSSLVTRHPHRGRCLAGSCSSVLQSSTAGTGHQRRSLRGCSESPFGRASLPCSPIQGCFLGRNLPQQLVVNSLLWGGLVGLGFFQCLL